MRRTLTYAFFIVGVVFFSSLIGLNFPPGEWYALLNKPPFNPPAWVFAPVWTLLYILIGAVGARLYLQRKRSFVMALWCVQMLLNWVWTPLFFGMHQPLLALLDMTLLLAAIGGVIALTWRVDRLAALLMLPYAAWVSFAWVLNASIVWLN